MSEGNIILDCLIEKHNIFLLKSKTEIMKAFIFPIFFITLLFCGCSQSIPADSLYLGQTPPDELPRIFAPGMLVSSGDWAGERIAISRDGKEIYFCDCVGGWGLPNSSIKIMYCKFTDGKWTKPSILLENFYAPTFSVDGDTLFFHRSDGIDVYYSTRNGSGWTKPLLYGKNHYYFQTTNSGNKYVGCYKPADGIGDMDICQLVDTTVRSLGTPVNTPTNDAEFFVAKDESFIITSKNESADNRDLYISFRNSDKTWSCPVGLVTSETDSLAFRWAPYVTSDNKYLFFTRGTSSKTTSLYWMRFDKLLDSLRASATK